MIHSSPEHITGRTPEMAGEPDIEDPPAPKVEQEEEQKNEESPEAEKEAAPAPAPAAPEFSYINTAREVSTYCELLPRPKW